MTIEEFLSIRQRDTQAERNVGKGLGELMTMFKCSKATAFKIAHSDWFKPALMLKEGKIIVFDKEVAYSLAKNRLNK